MPRVINLATQSVAVVFSALAVALWTADSQTVVGLARPFVDLQSVEHWVVATSLLMVAIGISAAGFLLAKRESESRLEA